MFDQILKYNQLNRIPSQVNHSVSFLFPGSADTIQIRQHSFLTYIPDRSFPEAVETLVKDGIQIVLRGIILR